MRNLTTGSLLNFYVRNLTTGTPERTCVDCNRTPTPRVLSDSPHLEPHGCVRRRVEVANKIFFVGNSSGQLTLEQFSMFVRLLQREALVMQFNQCDKLGAGLLTATGFAKFLVTKVCVFVRVCVRVFVCACALCIFCVLLLIYSIDWLIAT